MAGEALVVERRLRPVPEVRASEPGLRRVLLNLVANAREAMAGSEGTVEVSVSPVERAGAPGAEVLVVDDGPGMPVDLLRGVTDPGATTKAGSAGLGLATVVEVVEGCGGHLAVRSAPGEGFRVSIWLPAANPRPEEVDRR